MSFLRKLFGGKKSPPLNAQCEATPAQEQTAAVPPWDWSTPAPDNGSQLLQNLRKSLPPIFATVAKPGRDPVFVLADVVGELRWKGVIHQLFKHGEVHYSPEAICGLSPQFETISGEPFYKAPLIQGKQLRVGIYAVERESLFSELCTIRDVPPPPIKQVNRESPKDMFTVAYFCGLSLGVRYVSPDATKDESPPIDSFF